MMKHALYFTFNTLFRPFKFCPDQFSYVRKQLNKKAKVYFKIYDVIYWLTNNYNTHIALYLKK